MYKYLNVILFIIVFILTVYYFSNTYGKEEMKSKYANYQKWLNGNHVSEYGDGEDFDEPKLKDFVPTKTSPLKTLCNHEDLCMTY